MMREACPFERLQLAPQARFEFAFFNALVAETPPAEGFYFCLWRVGIGGMPRRLPPRRTPAGQVYRPSLPVDLYFLLLPVAGNADKQALMLGWALSFMNDLPMLSGETINRYTRGEPTIFESTESVELIADPLSTADYLSLWDRVKTGFQAGMTYVARMVLLDSEQVETQGRLVSERDFALHTIGETR
ncbi:Pvc16 family protein [Accumulibacter sp.]|uniref:Pvc16 family protein n=1 Tax=Accumulibacter sp. TaxID=2053492 RepID=UPI0025DF86E2|nr:Pvc16 family protein [Accumulibacter sp.]MCM8593848.1 DUF4255 domain-containing protein [Accumulibacter sp.]MCM8626110.1 DUF4255 domain-containing protein [Accumulibacter sp.]MDS4047989.1 Pvc16 family protein [Accumulibacter sp.]